MKKILSGLLIILSISLVSRAQLTHMGPVAGFASEVKEPGFGLSTIYRVNDQIKITPQFVYFLPHELNFYNSAGDLEESQKFDWWMINLDGNYVLLNKGVLEGYGSNH